MGSSSSLPLVETPLHNASLFVQGGDRTAIRSLEENIALGNNARAIADIVLPTLTEYGEPKMIQLLDFGEDIPKEGVPFISVPQIPNSRHLGVATQRFVLTPFNYMPHTHMLATIP